MNPPFLHLTLYALSFLVGELRIEDAEKMVEEEIE